MREGVKVVSISGAVQWHFFSTSISGTQFFKICQQFHLFCHGHYQTMLRCYNCEENVFNDKAPQSFSLNNKYCKYPKLEILCSITRYDSIRSDCLFALSITLPTQRVLPPQYIPFQNKTWRKPWAQKNVCFQQKRKPPSLWYSSHEK